MKLSVFAVCLLTLVGVVSVSADDPASTAWYNANGCPKTFPPALANLADQYNTCRQQVTGGGCSETCITQYAQGLAQLDCASPADMSVVVDACTQSCPGSSLCSLPKLQCAYPLAGHSCDNYVTCVEDVVPCGSDGYALGFGQKYCEAYLGENPWFSSYGQKWALQVRKCLQQKFVGVNVASMTCQQISDYALSTHFPCYEGPPSYCGLSFGDKLLVSTTAASALLSSRWLAILEQAIKVNAACFGASTSSASAGGSAAAGAPHLLTLRVTWNVPLSTIQSTLNDAQLHNIVMTFIQTIQTAVIKQFPSLPNNGTILFGTMGGGAQNTTLDIMISIDQNAPITVDIYAIATYIQQHLTIGDIGASPYPIANVQSLVAIPTTTTPPNNPNPNSNAAAVSTTTPIPIMLLVPLIVQLQTLFQ